LLLSLLYAAHYIYERGHQSPYAGGKFKFGALLWQQMQVLPGLWLAMTAILSAGHDSYALFRWCWGVSPEALCKQILGTDIESICGAERAVKLQESSKNTQTFVFNGY
jgi:hypothetical protein